MIHFVLHVTIDIVRRVTKLDDSVLTCVSIALNYQIVPVYSQNATSLRDNFVSQIYKHHSQITCDNLSFVFDVTFIFHGVTYSKE